MIDVIAYLTALLATDNAVLPNAAFMPLALHAMWALVLGSGVLLVAQPLPRPYPLGIAAAVMVWTLIPGSLSPAYWLGLAFQLPSLMSTSICVVWLMRQLRNRQDVGTRLSTPRPLMLNRLVFAGIILGWVLLLDTLAWWPVSVYAWGFSSSAVWALSVLLTLWWVMFGAARRHQARALPGLVLPWCVLALFVLIRLPTGNVWDALIDPWLWVILQLGCVVNLARRLGARGSAR